MATFKFQSEVRSVYHNGNCWLPLNESCAHRLGLMPVWRHSESRKPLRLVQRGTNWLQKKSYPPPLAPAVSHSCWMRDAERCDSQRRRSSGQILQCRCRQYILQDFCGLVTPPPPSATPWQNQSASKCACIWLQGSIYWVLTASWEFTNHLGL